MAGAANGQLVVSSLASGPTTPASTATAALSGTGVPSTAPPPPPPQAELLLPTAIDLGNFTIGGPSLSRSIRLHNTGTGPLTFSSIELTGPFTLVNDCPTVLAANDECALVIGFSATSPGAAQGTLTIVSNAQGGSGAIPVTARATRAPVPLVRIAPVQVGFGDRLIGTTSAAQRIVVLNEGGAAAAITGIVPSDDFILLGTSCGSTLASDQSCFADVAMRPTGFGPRNGELLINTNAAGSPHRVTLSGRGCRPFVAIGNRSGPRENCAP